MIYLKTIFHKNNDNNNFNIETSLQSGSGANRINMFWLMVYSSV